MLVDLGVCKSRVSLEFAKARIMMKDFWRMIGAMAMRA